MSVLCLSCNVKKPKISAKLSNMSRNKHYLYGVLCNIHAYTVTVTQHDQVPENVLCNIHAYTVTQYDQVPENLYLDQ